MMQLDAITLPDDLQWMNEFETPQSAQSLHRSLGGQLITQHASLLYGRQIHLRGGGDGGWITRATALAIRALQATPGLVMTLTDLPGDIITSRSVIFDQSSGPAFGSQMILRHSDPSAASWYSCELRLLTVAPP